jgi:hypothetical protein
MLPTVERSPGGLYVMKIEIDAIIAQVSALRENKDVLIGSLGREGYGAQIVYLLRQLSGVVKKGFLVCKWKC